MTGEEKTQTERKRLCEDRGRDRIDVASSQWTGLSWKAEEARNGISPQTSRLSMALEIP